MIQECNKVKPARCLFQSLENKLWNSSYNLDNNNNNNNTDQTKPHINQQCQQTFNLICQKSLEKFCRNYDLDLNQMKPVVDPNNCKINEGDQENQRHHRNQHTRHKQIWHWEQLDTTVNYVPTFYLNNRCHSDSYLLRSYQHEYPVPPNTPHKCTTKSSKLQFTDNKYNSPISFTLQMSHHSSHHTSSPVSTTQPVTTSFRVCRTRSRNSSNSTVSSGKTSKYLYAEHIRSKSEGKDTDPIRNSHLNERAKCSVCIDSTYRSSEVSYKLSSYSSSNIACSKSVNCVEEWENILYYKKEVSPCPPSTSNKYSLKQTKLTDMFPVNKPIKSCTLCTN
ncbi:unnamed protein product [Schistosoma rodhaini]|uniref:Uncharacterized protein n=1 Tax=Schistosoma rodhaini TaxID=6188 RepID=A0AA85GC60_9TREM|nr:unnamed protein product [Schistosoma rodhaini]CAH8623404.1 unnamed protein product [Schistosoma rodhaini]